MNKAIEIRPLLSQIAGEYHNVELLFNRLEEIIREWNKGKQADDRLQIKGLVEAVRLAERCRGELLDDGYQNLAYHLDHIGNLCGWAITTESKRKIIGGTLNLSIKRISQNPHWV